MASGSGDSVTRRSVASQFFTQEEGPGIDGMTTSERVSVAGRAWNEEAQPLALDNLRWQSPGSAKGAGLGWHYPLPLPFLPGGGSSEPGGADHQ